MPIKPIGLGAGNKFAIADDGSALANVSAGAITGIVSQAHGGLGVDASPLADGVLAKDAGVFLTTTSIAVPGVSTEAKQDDILAVLTNGTQRIELPLTVFGELSCSQPVPRVQIDAVCGILTTDVEALTDGASGSATASAGLFACSTGTSAGGYGVIYSRRLLRYRPGQGCVLRFTTMFSAPVANSLQLAGGFTNTEALCVAYSGLTFGYLRRRAGATAIWRLTVIAGSGGAETLTVRLNGTNFTVAAGGALSAAATAQLIAARVGGYTGWSSGVSPTSNGATVTFLQSVPAATVGTFTLTSTGAATGAFAEIRAGAANDDATNFVANSAWLDPLDGSGPSGMTIDPMKLNVWELAYPYLGGGSISLRVMTPNGRWALVYVDQYANANTIPSMRNPTLRVGWMAKSLGSTSAVIMKGASAAGFVHGIRSAFRDPNGKSAVFTGVSTTEQAYLLIRNRTEFAGIENQREVLPLGGVITVETANRIARVRYVLNPTLSSTVDWQYISQTTSCVEFATPTGITISGGTQVAASDAVTQSTVDFEKLDLRLEPGDVLAIAIQTASATATVADSINWIEE